MANVNNSYWFQLKGHIIRIHRGYKKGGFLTLSGWG